MMARRALTSSICSGKARAALPAMFGLAHRLRNLDMSKMFGLEKGSSDTSSTTHICPPPPDHTTRW